MLLIQVLTGLAAAVMIITALVWRSRRRDGTLHIRHFAWPKVWLPALEQRVPLYQRMPMDMRESLQDRMLEFIDGKRWRPGDGLQEVTREMTIIIAAHACALLVVHDSTAGFRDVLTVRVLPEQNVPPSPEEREALLTGEGSSSTVTLVWNATARTAQDLRDWDNPDLDEAIVRLAGPAGKLAGARGASETSTSGGPLFRHSAWARAACDAWRAAQVRQAAGVAADNAPSPAEAALPAGEEEFVVATEMFFHAPQRLLRRQPAVYQSLRNFYRMDPARWRAQP